MIHEENYFERISSGSNWSECCSDNEDRNTDGVNSICEVINLDEEIPQASNDRINKGRYNYSSVPPSCLQPALVGRNETIIFSLQKIRMND